MAAAALACGVDTADMGGTQDEPVVAEGAEQAAVEVGSMGSDAIEEVPVEAPILTRYDFDDRIWYVDLPGRLDEISGLAFTPDGRLFAHDDERGRVHEIDPATGDVHGHFDLGSDVARDDFEGIVVVGDRFFMIASTGLLYEFREAREETDFRRTDTGVGRGCEVEGLDYDPMTDELLLACKAATPDRGTIVVQRLPMTSSSALVAPLEIDRSQLSRWGIDEDFAPSAIAVTVIGSYLILSGRDHAIIEVDRDGRVTAAVELREGRHPQSEGLAIGPDGTLYVSDEKNGKDARLTAYGLRDEEGAL